MRLAPLLLTTWLLSTGAALAAEPVVAEPGAAATPPTATPPVSAAQTDTFPTPLAEPLARICIAIAMLSATGFGLAYWARQRRFGISGPNARIDIVATRSLGARHQVVLLDVGGHRLLVGTGSDSIRTLADLTESEAFAERLAQELPEKVEGPLVQTIGAFEGLDG